MLKLKNLSFKTLSTMAKPVETSIRKKLSEALEPIHLEVINRSHMHNAPKGAEMHFNVVVVSKHFEGVPLLQVLIA